jgi:hypothetical protein
LGGALAALRVFCFSVAATEPVFVSVSKRGTMSLPVGIRRRFHLDQPGAQVEVREGEGGDVIELRPHVAVPADQAWFWTPEWQEGEREADRQIANGEVLTFDSDEEFDAWLRSH